MRLDILERRLKKAEANMPDAKRIVVITLPIGETMEAVRARHFKEHPEDSNVQQIVYIRSFAGLKYDEQGNPINGWPD